MIRLAAVLSLLAGPLLAETVVAVRTIPARTLISAADLALSETAVLGGVADPALIVGQEARVALYAGRPIREGDVGPPAVVERNQIIALIYTTPLLTISTEGRAMERGGVGEVIRVMNLSSRTTVSARIDEGGQAIVSQ